MSKTVLIAGTPGATAKRLVELLVANDWRVIGVSRNSPPTKSRLSFVRADLLDPADSARVFRECPFRRFPALAGLRHRGRYRGRSSLISHATARPEFILTSLRVTETDK
jgi:nucleoside-diphosphate-sugar epimerase